MSVMFKTSSSSLLKRHWKTREGSKYESIFQCGKHGKKHEGPRTTYKASIFNRLVLFTYVDSEKLSAHNLVPVDWNLETACSSDV